MEREILFRAKHIHAIPELKHFGGRWVYGYLSDENHINSPELEGEFLVDPKTICQYTGLTDKNGLQKIFDGDIVSAPFMGYSGKTEIRKGVIEFVKGTFSVNWNDSEEYGKNFAGYVNDIEVIGNIFDNPELLRGA